MIDTPKTDEQALALALALAITANSSEAHNECMVHAEQIAARLSHEQIETCKAKALELAERFDA